MPNVAQVIRDHVTLEVECVDRLYLNGYIPTLQTPGQLVWFLTRHRGHPIPSPKLLGDITQQFHNNVRRFARSVGIPMVEFSAREKGKTTSQSAIMLASESPIGWFSSESLRRRLGLSRPKQSSRESMSTLTAAAKASA